MRATATVPLLLAVCLAALATGCGRDHERRAQLLAQWEQECTPVPPAPQVPIQGFGHASLRQELPPPVPAWTYSNALMYLEGKGPRPDVSCQQLSAMRDKLLAR